MRRVCTAFPHPSWTGNVKDGFNAAVLKLLQPVNITFPTTTPRTNVPPPGVMLSALGWGSAPLPTSHFHTHVNLMVVGNRYCPGKHDNVTDDMMCTYSRGKETCKGESAPGGQYL